GADSHLVGADHPRLAGCADHAPHRHRTVRIKGNSIPFNCEHPERLGGSAPHLRPPLPSNKPVPFGDRLEPLADELRAKALQKDVERWRLTAEYLCCRNGTKQEAPLRHRTGMVSQRFPTGRRCPDTLQNPEPAEFPVETDFSPRSLNWKMGWPPSPFTVATKRNGTPLRHRTRIVHNASQQGGDAAEGARRKIRPSRNRSMTRRRRGTTRVPQTFLRKRSPRCKPPTRFRSSTDPLLEVEQNPYEFPRLFEVEIVTGIHLDEPVVFEKSVGSSGVLSVHGGQQDAVFVIGPVGQDEDSGLFDLFQHRGVIKSLIPGTVV